MAPIASPDEATPFKALVGRWDCSGTFAQNGRPITATIVISWDDATASAFVRHDDLPPNGFHDVELWGTNKGGGFRSSIADAYSGVRWLTSPGWSSGALEWTRSEAGVPVEKFRYSDVSSAGFEIEWFVFGKDLQPKLGDSLRCRI